jgi:hypothetical protein
MAGHSSSQKVDQIVYREPEPYIALNLLSQSGVGPVSSSIGMENLSDRMLKLLAQCTAGNIRCRSGNLYYAPAPGMSGNAVLVNRTMIRPRGRDTTFAHVLIGPDRVLTPRRALALWDWDWPGAFRDAMPQPVLDKIDLGAPGVPQDPPDPGPATGHLQLALNVLIVDLLRRPSFDHVVVAAPDDRRWLLQGLLARISEEYLQGGFSGYELQYDGLRSLPPFVFSDVARRGEADVGRRRVHDLTVEHRIPPVQAAGLADTFCWVWKQGPTRLARGSDDLLNTSWLGSKRDHATVTWLRSALRAMDGVLDWDAVPQPPFPTSAPEAEPAVTVVGAGSGAGKPAAPTGTVAEREAAVARLDTWFQELFDAMLRRENRLHALDQILLEPAPRAELPALRHDLFHGALDFARLADVCEGGQYGRVCWLVADYVLAAGAESREVVDLCVRVIEDSAYPGHLRDRMRDRLRSKDPQVQLYINGLTKSDVGLREEPDMPDDGYDRIPGWVNQKQVTTGELVPTATRAEKPAEPPPLDPVYFRLIGAVLLILCLAVVVAVGNVR